MWGSGRRLKRNNDRAIVVKYLTVSCDVTDGKAYSKNMEPHLTTGPKNRVPSRPTLTSLITSKRSPCHNTTSPFSVLPSSSRMRSMRSDGSGRMQTWSAPEQGQGTEGVYKIGFGSKHLLLGSESALNATLPDWGTHGDIGSAIRQPDRTPTSLNVPVKALLSMHHPRVSSSLIPPCRYLDHESLSPPMRTSSRYVIMRPGEIWLYRGEDSGSVEAPLNILVKTHTIDTVCTTLPTSAMSFHRKEPASLRARKKSHP